ncbi:xanthine dehydrogenase/oxidase [Elysia marginata]|uniref:Xanthine dehydrogenase/oxidase n=1 Tax=Elysia marginata TaxID=1093978 RepID=A0AAV4IU03_9GAST|nr:xanthine dehydrogenase/oxidase [Elysia marginata]
MNQVCLAVPSEDGMDIYSATQDSNSCQYAASLVIDKPMNYVNITVPRLGGAFGGKGSDSSTVVAATSLAAYLSKRPVRLSFDLSTNIRTFGKRPPYKATYKAGFNKDGKVQVVEIEFISDVGFHEGGCFFTTYTMGYMDMCYFVPNWKVTGRSVMTNKRVMVAVRAPGSVPAALVSESIFEHVSRALNKHPTIVKELNLYQSEQKDLAGHVLVRCTVRELWRRLKDTAEVDARIRQVDAFNQDNMWKKRGITMTTCKYGMCYFGNGHGATVTIFAKDGSVQISQGGVEMGQGLYTKVAQGVAHILGVPLEKIKVRPNQGIISPNNIGSGGSIANESSMQAAIGAAEILKERMRPIREKFPEANWKELCQKSAAGKLDLTARFLNQHQMGSPYVNYHTYCIAVTETEVDILTGESQIRRVDIMADYGESLNPMIDIGQTEGGFVMGLGNFLTEDTLFDSKTGRILTDGTWNYKPPTTKDIPIDWRIHLLPDTPNPSGIRSSKATGEPSIALSVGGLLANKLALESARKDLLGKDDFIPVVAPFTVERAQQSVGLNESILAV